MPNPTKIFSLSAEAITLLGEKNRSQVVTRALNKYLKDEDFRSRLATTIHERGLGNRFGLRLREETITEIQTLAHNADITPSRVVDQAVIEYVAEKQAA